MRIDSNLNSRGVDGSIPPKRTSSVSRRTTDRTSFAGTDALDTSLKIAPDSRAIEVENARALIANPDYPPAEIIRNISTLLAAKLKSGEE